jgi:hypothetical protein
VPVCFFVGGEDLLFGVAAPGVDFLGVEFRAGLKSKKRPRGAANIRAEDQFCLSCRDLSGRLTKKFLWT